MVDKQKKVFNKIKKTSKKDSSQPKEKIYYSGLTIFLLFALIQVGWSVLMNFSKAVAFNGKISDLEHLKTLSATRNEQLKNEIKAYSQISKLEGIARNSLKMASEDEVLILINEQQPAEKTDAKSKK